MPRTVLEVCGLLKILLCFFSIWERCIIQYLVSLLSGRKIIFPFSAYVSQHLPNMCFNKMKFFPLVLGISYCVQWNMIISSPPLKWFLMTYWYNHRLVHLSFLREVSSCSRWQLTEHNQLKAENKKKLWSAQPWMGHLYQETLRKKKQR